MENITDPFESYLAEQRLKQRKIQEDLAAAQEGEANASNGWVRALAGLAAGLSKNPGMTKDILSARSAPYTNKIKALEAQDTGVDENLSQLALIRAKSKSEADSQLQKETRDLQNKKDLLSFGAKLKGQGGASRFAINPDTGEVEPVSGKQISAPTLLNVNEGNQIPKVLAGLRNTLENRKNQFGPISGRIGQINSYDTEAQTTDAQLRTASQMVGKFMEGGVLRKEDEEKYRKMLPTLTDTPEVAAAKLSQVEELLRSKQQSNLGALKASGYQTQGLERNLPQAPSANQTKIIGGKTYKKVPGGWQPL